MNIVYYHNNFIHARKFYKLENSNIMKKFIDFDKSVGIIYTNYYMDDSKIVLKVPIDQNDKVKIDEFDLTKYNYLVHYD